MAYDRLLRHRHLQADGTFLVTFCCAKRRPWLANATAAGAVAAAIDRLGCGGHCRSHAWVLMPDHVHWLLTPTGDRPVSPVVAACKASSTRAMQESLEMASSPWQAGYFEHRLRDHEDLQQQARYLVANPLRAGLVARMADYRWWFCEWQGSADADLFW